MWQTLFTWGDVVKVSKAAPARFLPGAVGEVCGIQVLDDNLDTGRAVYTLEFMDGSWAEIPDCYLGAAG